MDPYDVTHLGTAATVLAGSFAELWTQPPAADSPISRDMQWAATLPTTKIPNPVDHVLGHLMLRSTAVHASMLGLARLFQEPYFGVPVEIITRSLVETALSASWVLQGEDQADRVARGLAVAKDDASQEQQVTDGLKDSRPSRKTRIDLGAKEVIKYRDAVKNTLEVLQLPSVRKPSATGLFASSFENRLPDGIGPLAFLWTSGTAHGRPSALERGFDRDPNGVANWSPSPVMAMVMWRLSAEAVNVLAQATAAYLGWDVDGWKNSFEKCRADVMRADRLAEQLVAAELKRP